MKDWNTFFKTIYQKFNSRNIDFVISNMTTDVQWENGMDGGYVHGHDGVREYWTRQFKLVSSSVTPLEITEHSGRVVIKVRQVVHDPDGKLLGDDIVRHIFTMKGEKIARFDIDK
jgi:hypothetical protein